MFNPLQRNPTSQETRAHLTACEQQLAAAEKELIARREAYEIAIARSAASESRTGSLEARRTHKALTAQQAAVQRAKDAVTAATQRHARTEAREHFEKGAAAWDQTEQLARDRVRAAERFAAAAAAAGEARRAYADVAARHSTALRVLTGSVPGADPVQMWRSEIDRELQRADVIPDQAKAMGFPAGKTVVEQAQDLVVLTNQLRVTHRAQALRAQSEQQDDAA